MKRRIISALAGIFAIAVFTGCQQPAQSSDSGTKKSNEFEGTSYGLTASTDGSSIQINFDSYESGTLVIKTSKTTTRTYDFTYSSMENMGNYVSFVVSYAKPKTFEARRIGTSLFIENEAENLFVQDTEDCDVKVENLVDNTHGSKSLTLKKL